MKHRRAIRPAATSAALSLTLLSAASAPAAAQRVAGPIGAGSRVEDSLRVEQILGRVPLRPWSVRAFSWRESDRLTRPPHDSAALPRRGVEWTVLPVRAQSWINSSFPYGYNDGPVWQGRGLTAAVDGGIAARAGWVSLTVAPMVWWAQNVPFTLMPNGRPGDAVYGDGLHPQAVDLPQRFGNSPMLRIDPGQSTLAVEAPVLTAGLSARNEWWGPMTEFPYVLGNNAAGFPHLYLGTSEPADLWLFRLSARAFYGRLDQSAYTEIPDSLARRFMTGFVLAIQPRGVPGLELGAGRFFHQRWPDHFGWAQLRKPFEAVLKKNLPETGDTLARQNPDNQLATAFARWVLPRSGVEVYAEYGREDHNWNTRDFVLEPDHATSLGLGFRKAWVRADSGVTALRAELIDFRPSGLIHHRGEGGIYLHGRTRQGHTSEGQLLGAAVGVGSAAGSTIELSRGSRAGATVVTWTRILRQETGRYWTGNLQDPRAVDVSHALEVRRIVPMGRVTITAGLSAVYELNRDFRSDALDARGQLSAEWHP